MMKKIIIVLSFLLLSACSTTYPAITEYRIDAPLNLPHEIKSSCSNHSLTVAQVFVPSTLMSKKMKYVVGEYEEFAYNESEWAQKPNRAISDAIVKALQNAEIFQTVSSYKSFSHSDYTLESRVEAFGQYFSEDEKSSFVKIEVTFSLIDNKTAQVLQVKHITKTKKTQKADAKSGVIALNELLGKSLEEMVLWIGGSCK